MAADRLYRLSIACSLLAVIAGCSFSRAAVPVTPVPARVASAAVRGPEEPAPTCTPGAPGALASRCASAAAPAPRARPAKNYIYGQIVSIQQDHWTVIGIKGNVYTVHVSSLTVFGDLFHASKRSEFTVGQHVRVAGVFVGTTVNATAIAHSNRAPRR